jgi:hypothetical protein
MNTRLFWKTCALVLGCGSASLLPLCSAFAAGAPDSSSATRAKNQEARNLARLAAGASLEVQAPGSAAPAENATASQALLRDDDPLGYALAPGNTALIVSLPRIEVLNRFDFLNLTAGGKVAIAISSAKLPADSSRWHPVQTLDFSGDNAVVTCDLGSVEAKYVRISFAVPAEGRIDTFGLYGRQTISDGLNARGLAGKGQDGDARFMMFNYAVDGSHAGVVMVSPGEDLEQAQQMADGDVGTSYTFKPSDPAPMAVIDLGESRALSRVSASFKAGPGRLAVYLVPDPQDAPAKGVGKRPAAKTIEDFVTTDFPGDLTPILAADTGSQPGLNRIGANVSGQSGRYLVMMFHPSGSLPATGGADFKDFKDRAETTDFKDVDGGHTASDAPVGSQPLQIAEITGYGNTPPGATTTTPLIPPPAPGPPTGPVPPPIGPPGSGTVTP